MADHTIDPNLLAQLEVLREQLSERFAASSNPRCLELLQDLDHLSMSSHRGEIHAVEAAKTLSEVSAELEALSSTLSPADVRLDLIQETLPTPLLTQRDARNQERLIDHLLEHTEVEQPENLNAIQEAVQSYARLNRRAPTDAAPSPVALQKNVSQRLETRLQTQIQSRLMRREDVEAFREAIEQQRTPDEAHTTIESSGDLQSDLLSLLGRLDPKELSGDLFGEEMVLARVETDTAGAVRDVRLHALRHHAPAETEPVEASSPRQLVASTFASEAVKAHAEARFNKLREALAKQQDASDDARAEVEAARVQAEATAQRATDAHAALLSAQEDSKKRVELRHLIKGNQFAAREIFKQQRQALLNTTARFSGLLKKQTPGEGEDAHLRADADQVDAALSALSGDTSDQHTVIQLGQTLQEIVRGSITRGGDNTQSFRALADQLSIITDRAAQAYTASTYAPLLGADDATEPLLADEASLQSAEAQNTRALLEATTARFEHAHYQSAALEEQVLVVEKPFAEIFPNNAQGLSRRSRRPDILDLSTPSMPQINVSPGYAAITSEVSSDLRRLQGLNDAHATPSVDFYADTAGLEIATTARQALTTNNEQTSSAASFAERGLGYAFARLGELNQQAAQLARSAAELTGSRSGRRDLGMPTVERYEMDSASTSPLFKRKVGLNREGRIGSLYMPALHEVAGLSPKQSRSITDAGENELALGRLNHDARAIRQSQGQILRSLQRFFGPSSAGDLEGADALSSTLARLEQWSDEQLSRTTARQAQPTDDGEDVEHLVDELRGEGSSIPFDVGERLRPMLQFDLSDVKVYTGSRASKIAEDMGAHAFTLGKHIFGRIDFGTVEGLSLFAHEAVHTQHFHDSGTVDQKEAEAEAMERQVMNVLSGGAMDLALDRPTTHKQDGVLRASGNRVTTTAPSAASSQGGSDSISQLLQSTQALEKLAKIILQTMQEEMQRERERRGRA